MEAPASSDDHANASQPTSSGGGVHEPKSLRDQVIEKFVATLGKPEITEVKLGQIYRWTLDRGGRYMNVYVTVDSPEFPHLAHIMVSDGASHQVNPIETFTVFTHDEADTLLERIVRQWKSVGVSSS